MRIETSGEYAWRTDLYDETGDLLDENTRSGAIDGACEFTRQMLPALAEAGSHPDMTEDLAEVLSTRIIEVEYRIERGVDVATSERPIGAISLYSEHKQVWGQRSVLNRR